MTDTLAAQIEALTPCPNPWCTSRSAPLPVRSRMASNGWHVACACGVRSWACPSEGEAIATWNTRPAIVTALRQAEHKPMSEQEAFVQLKRLYNYRDDNSEQFTRWQMVIALQHAASSEGADGWVITSADGERYRTWRNGSPDWTSNPYLAVRYARRWDAERVHEEDEDAWRVVPFPCTDALGQAEKRTPAPDANEKPWSCCKSTDPNHAAFCIHYLENYR